ncbi:uncharacterized protein RhoGAP71E isoform X7 [Eurosta solidaginis]|uniref:uncharacterized protein RhoGAP71E isoform X7 n=1 Tax=Eurosta solidaginis TaxID=178769 RepID=UPI0035307543
MSSWARRAADISSVVTSCGHPGTSAPDYIYRLEKVKFGVPLEEVCKNNDNIPGPLLVLILKLNKESPNRRDVFRAPGHQGAMKKLIHFLQAGRLVNVDNYSVYTIASVLKKFLRKIPNGIFGRSGENELFDIIDLDNELEQMERLHRLFTSLPKYTQRLLVLLFGTFRVIASNATQASTGMTSEALGVSVAPSFFQSCVSDGKTARMEDVLKFKVATKIMKQIIDKFATHDLFGRENYEYYARVTGRILKVQDDWICSFQYPPPPRGKLAQQKYALQHSLEAEKTWLQCQCERWGLPTTTTTKPITAHYDLLLHHRSDNHYHHHHDHEHHHCHYPPCPRNSIADSSSSYPIQRSQPHQHHHHPQRRCTANQTATQERRYSSMLLPNHYHSTDSVPYCDVDLVVDIVEDDVQTPSSLPSLSPARLYFSPRKQIVATTNKRRYKSTLDLYKSTFDHDDDDFDAEYKEHQDVNDKHQAHNSDFEHNYFTCCTPLPSSEYLNFSDFDATSPPPHTSSMLCEAFNDDSVSFLKSSTLIDSSAASSSAAPTASIKTAAPLSMPLAAAEEVDFIQTSRYRQSTPRIHRRQHQLVRRRQRLTSSSSNSTQYQSLNSTSVSNVGGTAAAGGGGGSGGNGVGNTLRTESGGNNFVTIIFNVLDFLF